MKIGPTKILTFDEEFIEKLTLKRNCRRSDVYTGLIGNCIEYRAIIEFRGISAGMSNSCLLHDRGIAVRFQAGVQQCVSSIAMGRIQYLIPRETGKLSRTVTTQGRECVDSYLHGLHMCCDVFT
jgi:hypothetical protein